MKYIYKFTLFILMNLGLSGCYGVLVEIEKHTKVITQTDRLSKKWYVQSMKFDLMSDEHTVYQKDAEQNMFDIQTQPYITFNTDGTLSTTLNLQELLIRTRFLSDNLRFGYYGKGYIDYYTEQPPYTGLSSNTPTSAVWKFLDIKTHMDDQNHIVINQGSTYEWQAFLLNFGETSLRLLLIDPEGNTTGDGDMEVILSTTP